jgi:hypothetical protein
MPWCLFFFLIAVLVYIVMNIKGLDKEKDDKQFQVIKKAFKETLKEEREEVERQRENLKLSPTKENNEHEYKEG